MTEKKNFLIGSRGSQLSLAYSGHVKHLLLKTNPQFDSHSIEIKITKTSKTVAHRNECNIFLPQISPN